MTRRKYMSGTRWCLWRWTDVDSEYITRLHVLKTPLFAICLHWINKPDPEPYLHDHPVSFLSIILRGWYAEKRVIPGTRAPRFGLRRWFNWIRATPDDRHTIVQVAPGGALTLCLMGPKTREWGFHCIDETSARLSTSRDHTERGWTYWRDYHHAQRAERAAQYEREWTAFETSLRAERAQTATTTT